jgi:hypothetical protein
MKPRGRAMWHMMLNIEAVTFVVIVASMAAAGGGGGLAVRQGIVLEDNYP